MTPTPEELIDVLKTTYSVNADGTQFWYLNGDLHRVNGPAIIDANGTQYWFLNGELHRVDGPAVIYSNGTQMWYLNGIEYREEVVSLAV